MPQLKIRFVSHQLVSKDEAEGVYVSSQTVAVAASGDADHGIVRSTTEMRRPTLNLSLKFGSRFTVMLLPVVAVNQRYASKIGYAASTGNFNLATTSRSTQPQLYAVPEPLPHWLLSADAGLAGVSGLPCRSNLATPSYPILPWK